jgi:hypothetical protein
MIQEAFQFPHPVLLPLHGSDIHAYSSDISTGFGGIGGTLSAYHHISCIA